MYRYIDETNLTVVDMVYFNSKICLIEIDDRNFCFDECEFDICPILCE